LGRKKKKQSSGKGNCVGVGQERKQIVRDKGERCWGQLVKKVGKIGNGPSYITYEKRVGWPTCVHDFTRGLLQTVATDGKQWLGEARNAGPGEKFGLLGGLEREWCLPGAAGGHSEFSRQTKKSCPAPKKARMLEKRKPKSQFCAKRVRKTGGTKKKVVAGHPSERERREEVKKKRESFKNCCTAGNVLKEGPRKRQNRGKGTETFTNRGGGQINADKTASD